MVRTLAEVRGLAEPRVTAMDDGFRGMHRICAPGLQGLTQGHAGGGCT